MTLEPWMLRTAFVLLGVNCLNVLLFFLLRSLERRQNAARPVGSPDIVADEAPAAKAA